MNGQTENQNPVCSSGSSQEPVVINRQQAISVFFKAIDHDDPYWTDTLEAADESLLVFNEDDDLVSWPSQFDIGRALGFTDEEMESATGTEKGRLKELGL